MNRKIIILSVLVLGLILNGCKPTNTKDKVLNESVTSNMTDANNAVADKNKKNTPAQILAKPTIPVLCYHRIADGKKSEYSVTPATFSAHMRILADSGYHSILPDQLYDYLAYNKPLPEKPVMITFDDSREEHASIAAPVMEKNGFRGVFFIMTITYNKKNYMTTQQITALAKAGHTVGLHSWDHTMVVKYKEPADWTKQVVAPKEKLEKIVGQKIQYWAYPNGVYNHHGAEELNRYFKLSFTLMSKRDSIFPLQTVRRMIVPEEAPQGLLKSMHKNFGKKS